MIITPAPGQVMTWRGDAPLSENIKAEKAPYEEGRSLWSPIESIGNLNRDSTCIKALQTLSK